MKGYKLTLARIGVQEKWAGWQIAGKTNDTPQSAIDSFTKSQSAKGVVGTALRKPLDVYEGLEHAGNYIISRTKFGLLDGLGRPCSRSDGLVFPLADNPDMYSNVKALLSFDFCNFDNMVLKDLYDENGQLKPTINNLDSIKTIYKDEIIFTKNYNLLELVEKYFKGNKDQMFSFVRCIFWTVSTPLPLYIITEMNYEELFELVFIAFSVLPYSLRSKLSFRSYNVPKLDPANIIFSATPVKNSKEYNWQTGKDNIFDTGMSNMFNNYTFINYISEHLLLGDIDDYFIKLNKQMKEFGDSNSDDYSFINVAHTILLEKERENYDDISDDLIKERLNTFLSIQNNNQQIDDYIASYLEQIIKKNIKINDSLQKKLRIKLEKTNSKKLQDVGYSYKAKLMVDSSTRDEEFSELYSIIENTDFYNDIIKKISQENGGDDFLDEYYGDYYGPKTVHDLNAVKKFYRDTQSLNKRNIIDSFIKETINRFGFEIVNEYYKNNIDIISKLKEFYTDASSICDNSFANKMLNEIRLYYWDNFNISDFKYGDKDIYSYLEYRSHGMCELISKLIAIFTNIKSQNISTVNSFSKLIKNYFENTQDSQKKNIENKIYLTEQFKKQCLYLCNRKRNLDFWSAVAMLNPDSCISFIVSNRIYVFITPDYFYDELNKSEYFDIPQNRVVFIELIRRYIDSHSDVQSAEDMLDVLRDYTKEQSKYEKKEKHEKERSMKKKALPHAPVNISEETKSHKDKTRSLSSSDKSSSLKHVADNSNDKKEGLISKIKKFGKKF